MKTRLVSGALTIGLVLTAFCANAEYKTEVFIPGHAFHGIHGLTFDSEDRLYVGSVIGQSIYRIDTATGASEIWEAPPLGMADDLEFGPDGTLVWTSFILGKVHARKGNGEVRELASGLAGINSIAFKQDGRLFATQVFSGDALYEIDVKGEKPPRKIMENMGGLNGFDFGPDGYLYGPIWFKGQVARVDVDTGELTVVAEGFKIPAAANFNSKGELFVLDTARGEVVKVDPQSGAKSVVATVRTAMDNLAFDSQDNLYVTVMAENSVFRVDTASGTVSPVKVGELGLPADMTIRDNTLYVADTFTIRAIDLANGEVSSFARFPEDELEYCNGIDVTDKHVHTTSWFNSAVQTFDRKTGELLHTYHDLPTAYDVLENEDGSLLVLQMFTGSILHITGHDPEDRKIIARKLTTPVAMVRAGKGSVYVSLFAKGEVVKVDLATGEQAMVAEGLDRPEGLAVAPDGSVLVAEAGTGNVVRIDADTGAKEVIGTGIPMGLPLAQGMPPMGITAGIAVASDGTVYAASDIEDAIYRVSED